LVVLTHTYSSIYGRVVRILVIGGGGREHALAWKLSAEEDVREVVSAPGNPGIAPLGRTLNIDVTDINALAAFAEHERIELTVVGPELPLSHGIVDVFEARGLRIFGPTRAAAQLESSKAFAKAFMSRHGIPTARYRVCDSAAAAYSVLDSGELGLPVVIKADGLAAGKGVVIAPDAAAARAAVSAVMEERRFGDAGSSVVIEECLEGPEVSFFAISDGVSAQPLGSAQDHKRAYDDDEGPNTGGMGAFAPSPLVDDGMQSRIMREIVHPVVDGMSREGYAYRGFLYVGLMLTCAGPKVIEFNVRFGDPEAQVVLPRIAGSLAPRLASAAGGALDPHPVAFTEDKHVGVVIASKWYPASGATGLPITGLDHAAALDGVAVFHSGTRYSDERRREIVTAGGRVLTVVARGETYQRAIDRAYSGVALIHFDGMHYRRDIGRKAQHV
jgi:phosphoribosylamine--glycine ligase